MNVLYQSALIGAVFILLGCQHENTGPVTFSPDQGQEKTYIVSTNTSLSIPEHNHTEQLSSYSQLRYLVTQKNSKKWSFDVYPEYMSLSGNQINIASDQPEGHDKEWRNLMHDGFEFSVDPTSGKLMSFVGKNTKIWNERIESHSKAEIEQLRNSFLSPGIAATIPVTKGKSVEI